MHWMLFVNPQARLRLAVAAGCGIVLALVLVLAWTGDDDRSSAQPGSGSTVATDRVATTPAPQTVTSVLPTPTETVPTFPANWRFVATDGRVDGQGSYADPYATLERAFQDLAPGVEVVLREGVHASGPDITVSGTIDDWVVIRSFEDEKATIVADNGNGIRTQDAAFVRIEGLVFRSAPGSTIGAGIRADAGSHHIEIVGNDVFGFPGAGIGSNRSNGISVLDNVVSGNSNLNPLQTSGISLFRLDGSIEIESGGEYDNVIAGNLVYGNENLVSTDEGKITDGNCIIIDRSLSWDRPGKNPNRSSTLIANNICSMNGGRGIHVFVADTVTVVNNTIVENLATEELRENGAELSAVDSDDVVFANNLVIARAGLSGTSTSRSSNVRFVSNAFGADTTQIDWGDSEVLVGQFDLVADASDPSSFGPGPRSLVVGAAAAEFSPELDFFGLPRDSSPDIGAVEVR